MKHRVCVITGSRSDYGLLRGLMALISADISMQLQIIATGMHLSHEYGDTIREVQDDGFHIDHQISVLTESNKPLDIARAIGDGITKISVALDELECDAVIILGDRFEMMAAAQAAVVLRIPIVHLCGGDLGSNTFDNLFRDCISIMSDLHCVTHEEARRRLIGLGLPSASVHCVGATFIENTQESNLMSLDELAEQLSVKINGDLITATFHPLTRGHSDGSTELLELLLALEAFASKNRVTIIFTGTNADPSGHEIQSLIDRFVATHDDCYMLSSLGHRRYLSLVKHSLMVIGNSSSGIYEAPYLETSSIDVGTRQLGRIAPSSVLRCQANRDEILTKMQLVLTNGFKKTKMLFGDGSANQKILQLLKDFLQRSI